jgi:biopolymer transport protein TolQ
MKNYFLKKICSPLAKIITLFFVMLTFSPTLVQAAPPVSNSSGLNYSVLTALWQASFVVQLVILILISLSILCWAIAWSKYREFQILTEANEAFGAVFWKSSSLDELYSKVSLYSDSSQARLFKNTYSEMKKISESPLLNGQMSNQFSGTAHIHMSSQSSVANDKTNVDEVTLTNVSGPQLSGLDNLERTLRKSIENELATMEAKLTILATTGSTGPFIGLFGTVWGIMSSFESIAKTGSASLAAVAPGISEALITTAIGLAAAIPAVIMYNHFVSVIKKEEIELNNFSSDFLNILKRNFFKN